MSQPSPNPRQQAWSIDQLTKSEFFHQKLHEWALLEVAEAIESVQGETLDWSLAALNISETAWNKVIHRGIKPIIVFAHPAVFTTIPHSVGYYRMLAMVSQKSMSQIGHSTTRYEQSQVLPTSQIAISLAHHLNKLISNLIEADEHLNPREFDLWRGMSAGTQAQGAWQNVKGNEAEIIIKGMLQRRFREQNLLMGEEVVDEKKRYTRILLRDGRIVTFGDEPDIAILENDSIVAAVEVKGGIDPAGILERLGAAVKSLSRSKEENPQSVTILIVPAVSMTTQAKADLEAHRASVNHWFTVEEIIDNDEIRAFFFNLLRL